MLQEITLAEALEAFVKNEEVTVLNVDDLVALSLNIELEHLKNEKVNFLVERAVETVKEPKETKPSAETEGKRKYTRKAVPQKRLGTTKRAFDAGKCQALIDAGRDLHFLCVEFEMDEAEMHAEMEKHGITDYWGGV